MEFDIFVTALRRKYIPPLMECFQDILVFSTYYYDVGKNDEEILLASESHLKTVHQKVVDTFHPVTKICPSIYFVLVKQKAEALLMDEQTMAYFSQQLNIRPQQISCYAIAYVRSILKILRKTNAFGLDPLITDLKNKRLIEEEQNGKTMRKEIHDNASPQQIRNIIHQLDQGQDHYGQSKQKRGNKEAKSYEAKGAVWRAKVARYLAWCVDGGLLQSKFTI